MAAPSSSNSSLQLLYPLSNPTLPSEATTRTNIIAVLIAFSVAGIYGVALGRAMRADKLSPAGNRGVDRFLCPKAGFMPTTDGTWLWSLHLNDGAGDILLCGMQAQPLQPRGSALALSLALGLPLVRLRAALPELLWRSTAFAHDDVEHSQSASSADECHPETLFTGTALVLAYMALTGLVPAEELVAREQAAAMALKTTYGIRHLGRWSLRHLRGAFFLMLSPDGGLRSDEGAVWHAAARGWRLVLSQHRNGSWTPDHSLAFALTAALSMQQEKTVEHDGSRDSDTAMKYGQSTFSADVLLHAAPAWLQRMHGREVRRQRKLQQQQAIIPSWTGTLAPAPDVVHQESVMIAEEDATEARDDDAQPDITVVRVDSAAAAQDVDLGNEMAPSAPPSPPPPPALSPPPSPPPVYFGRDERNDREILRSTDAAAARALRRVLLLPSYSRVLVLPCSAVGAAVHALGCNPTAGYGYVPTPEQSRRLLPAVPVRRELTCPISLPPQPSSPPSPPPPPPLLPPALPSLPLPSASLPPIELQLPASPPGIWFRFDPPPSPLPVSESSAGSLRLECVHTKAMHMWCTLLAARALAQCPVLPLFEDGTTPVDSAWDFLVDGYRRGRAAEMSIQAADAALESWKELQLRTAGVALASPHLKGLRSVRLAGRLTASLLQCLRFRHWTFSALLAPPGGRLFRWQRTALVATLVLVTLSASAQLRASRERACCVDVRTLLKCSADPHTSCGGMTGATCAQLASVMTFVQGSGLVGFSCTRFPDPNSSRDLVASGLMVSAIATFTTALLDRAFAAGNSRSAAMLFARGRLSWPPSWPLVWLSRRLAPDRGAMFRAMRWGRSGSNSAADRFLIRVAMAPNVLDTMCCLVAYLLAVPFSFKRAWCCYLPHKQPERAFTIATAPRAPLMVALWVLFTVLLVTSLLDIQSDGGRAAMDSFIVGTAAAFALDQLAQWRDVYQDAFTNIAANLAMELLSFKQAASLWPQTLDFLSIQVTLTSTGREAQPSLRRQVAIIAEATRSINDG